MACAMLLRIWLVAATLQLGRSLAQAPSPPDQGALSWPLCRPVHSPCSSCLIVSCTKVAGYELVPERLQGASLPHAMHLKRVAA